MIENGRRGERHPLLRHHLGMHSENTLPALKEALVAEGLAEYGELLDAVMVRDVDHFFELLRDDDDITTDTLQSPS